MAGKGKKSNNSKDVSQQSSSKKKKNGDGGKRKKKSGSGKSKGSKFHGDIFTEGAMENAYFICHNIQDVLKNRGFPWPEAQKKKKKGKRK